MYQAGNAFAGLTAGNYNVVVQDADGCTVTAVVNIPQPPIINIANVVVNATCGNANGSITVNANGGTGVLTYSNNNGVTYQAGNVFNGLVAGNYDIVVKDANGCTSTVTASVSNEIGRAHV